MSRTWRKTLKREVFSITLFFALVATGVIMFTLALVLYSARTNELKEKLNNASTQSVTYLNTLFTGNERALGYLTRSMDLINLDPEKRDDYLAVFMQEEGSGVSTPSVFVAYPNGYLLMNEFEPPPEYDVTARPWYQEALKAYPNQLVAYPFEATTSGVWSLVSAIALADDTGQVRAVIGTFYYAEDIYQSVPMKYQYETQEVFLVNDDGLCIYHPNAALIDTPVMDGLRGRDAELQGNAGYIEIDILGVHKVGYFRRIENSGSILVSVADRSEVLQPAMWGVTITMLIMCALALTVALHYSYVFDKRFIKPVHLLKNRMTELLNGQQIQSLPVYQNQEFQEIAKSMEELAQHIISQKVEELNAILESSSDGIVVFNQKGEVLHYNARFLQLWGVDEAADFYTLDDLALQEKEMDGKKCDFYAEVKAETASDDEGATFLRYLKNGTILERYTRLLKVQGDISAVLCVFRDVTQKMKKEAMLTEHANTDFLTGFANRRHFAFLTVHALQSALEDGEPLSLLLIDLDRFKEINDSYGHDVGDLVLKEFADHLRQCSRKNDILGRYGGDEFTMLLPYTDSDLGLQIAERVRAHMEHAVFEKDGRKITWTVSIGVATVGAETTTYESLIKQADLACYAAKQKGRNHVAAQDAAQHGTYMKEKKTE